MIMACRSLEKAEKAKSEIEATGIKGKISVVHLDVLDRQSIKKASEHLKTKFGRVDALVNNAAVGNNDPDMEVRMRACLEANVIGPVIVTDEMLPLLFKSKNAYSLYISSGIGSFGHMNEHLELKDYPNMEGYRASKAALNAVVDQESHKYKGKGLKTFAVCPGFVRSNLRGTHPDQVNPGGMAGDPEVSGKLILDIIEGKRDAKEGLLVQENGTYPW